MYVRSQSTEVHTLTGIYATFKVLKSSPATAISLHCARAVYVLLACIVCAHPVHRRLPYIHTLCTYHGSTVHVYSTLHL